MNCKILFVLSGILCNIKIAAQKLDYPLQTSVDISYPQLKEGFMQPPAASRLRCYWWWLNSMATKESITRDLEQMKLNGYGGASLVDAGSSNYTVAAKTKAGPVFMSQAWMELYKHAVKEADRLGIELSVNTQSGWNPGGPTITPELALKKIVYTDTIVQGGKKIEIQLRQPPSKLLYRDIMVQAFQQPANMPLKEKAIQYWGIKSFNETFGFKGTYPLNQLREENSNAASIPGIQPTAVIDLSSEFNNGILSWEAPAGEWTIIRYGWTCTGAVTSTNSDGWEGLSVDHLDAAAFKKFSNDVILPLINTAQSAGKSLHFLQTDSWEMGNVGWTNDFINQFKKFRGYDMVPYLPVLAGRVVGNVDQSDRFLHDYRQTIGDCVAANHYQLFSDLAHAHGMGIHPESGGPHSAPVDALKVMAISDFPQGEFWAESNTHRVKDDERLAVKQAACVAHTNGKRFVAAEGPTSIGPQWERSPKDLKRNIDRVFCSGVNRIVWHTFTSSPKEFGLPGNEYFAGTHMNPNVTWWKQAANFISYLNRSSYLLQQGLFAADVLYYYGDDVPNFVFVKEGVHDLRFGYDWDKCSKDALINRALVKDSKLVFPDGMTYRVLVLPPERAIDLAVLRKLEGLVKDGLTVIGPRPVKATGLANYPDSDAELNNIAERMWGTTDGSSRTENNYGKGKLIWGKTVNTVLDQMNVAPDFSFTGTKPDTYIDYIHRTANDMDIYFVANRFGRKGINDFEYRYLPTLPDRYESVECSFRVRGMIPELWDPITGRIEKIPVYREENNRIVIPLYFEPEGSKFIVFRKGKPPLHITAIEKDGQRIFPGNQFKNDDRPVLSIKNSGENIYASGQPGDYTMTWSGGKISKEHIPARGKEILLKGKWEINFDTAWGGPAHVTTDTLKSWTLFSDAGIKYYSGTAVYKKAFIVSDADLKGTKAMLDLGNVLEMASITINGHKMAVKWNAPFQFDISDFIKPGSNRLEVEVVNLWPNRLIGDGKLPPEKRFTRTNIMKYNAADAETMLRPSGLEGPVKIVFVPTQKIK